MAAGAIDESVWTAICQSMDLQTEEQDFKKRETFTGNVGFDKPVLFKSAQGRTANLKLSFMSANAILIVVRTTVRTKGLPNHVKEVFVLCAYGVPTLNFGRRHTHARMIHNSMEGNEFKILGTFLKNGTIKLPAFLEPLSCRECV